jgi:hypothetical protein
MDIDLVDKHVRVRRSGVELLRLRDGTNADDASARAVILECHASSDFRKQRVVLPETHVESGPEPPTALPNENRSTGHDVAIEPLDAETLRIAVATVP